MKSKRKKEKKSPVIIVLDTIIVLACIGVIVSAFSMIRSFQYTYYGYSPDTFYYRLLEGDYPSMVRLYYENEENDVKEEGDLGEYYGVAKYFEAASYYKIYEESGDTVRANHQKKKMETALKEMGDLSAEADRIKEQLDISE